MKNITAEIFYGVFFSKFIQKRTNLFETEIAILVWVQIKAKFILSCIVFQPLKCVWVYIHLSLRFSHHLKP